MSCLLDSKHNMMLSPFSVWSVLALLTEGASGNTHSQLRSTLHLDMGKRSISQRYQTLDKNLKATEGSAVEFDSANVMVTDENRPVLQAYENVVRDVYNAHIIPVNFHKMKKAAQDINSWVSNVTHNRIPHIVNEGDLKVPHLILANAVYFKGTWKYPFNESETTDEDFFDEAEKVIAKVPTMKQTSKFVFGYIPEVESHMLVLPYLGDQFSMVLAMPQKKVPLLQMLERIKLASFHEVLRQLHQIQGEFAEDVRVHLPRFLIQSDFVLNSPLVKMGIADAFSDRANFRRISSQDIYVSKLIHKAEIEVNERGTIASAASGVMFVDKMLPSVFKANRPFAYFIIENEHKSVLFAGRVSNPAA
ncbi:serine protease inhibitor 77Ba isoform X2 [Anabrus simplex]